MLIIFLVKITPPNEPKPKFEIKVANPPTNPVQFPELTPPDTPKLDNIKIE
ncbi:MAG: hypothetical protein K2L48_00250 [Mycoplasmoidaceae bacterium]|nr:hypothetical protein [Mycoplasmoidaceae bacterium]